ncbi:carboxypeptidase regulatory-like domain-containing protein [bacterium]|nr:carboxypeptidase regulatory-like domain-containing protein [bacterium]
MKYFILLTLLFFTLSVNAQPMEVGISKTGAANQIIDIGTNMPVPNAKITLPKQNYTTYTDDNGLFNITGQINDSSVLAVEKEGYRPFSLTINEKIASKPIVIGIEKTNAHDIVISTEMIHLGDDNFSQYSANSGEFKGHSSGPFYSKMFPISQNCVNKNNYLIIGSIIGIDTLMARSMKQNNITNSFSSPPEIYLNGKKIAEIQINGDGQKIKLPNNLVRAGSMNEITIKTGHNLHQTAYIDYDDIEFMNLSVVSE